MKPFRSVLRQRFAECKGCDGAGRTVAMWGLQPLGTRRCKRCDGHGKVVIATIEEEQKLRGTPGRDNSL